MATFLLDASVIGDALNRPNLVLGSLGWSRPRMLSHQYHRGLRQSAALPLTPPAATGGRTQT